MKKIYECQVYKTFVGTTYVAAESEEEAKQIACAANWGDAEYAAIFQNGCDADEEQNAIDVAMILEATDEMKNVPDSFEGNPVYFKEPLIDDGRYFEACEMLKSQVAYWEEFKKSLKAQGVKEYLEQQE